MCLSWKCRSFQGFDCSSIKKQPDLGSERRETVWSLSTKSKIVNKKNFFLVRED